MRSNRPTMAFAGLLLTTTAASAAAAAEVQATPAAVTAGSGLDARGHLQSVVPAAAGFAYARLQHGVQIRVGGVVKNIVFHGPDTVRVNANLGQNYWTAPSIVVIAKPADVAFEVAEEAGTLVIRSAKLTITVDKRTGALTFADATGRVYTREAGRLQKLRQVQISGKPTYEAENGFTLKPDEGIYGFGFTDDAQINRRGRELELVQTNIGIIIPVMMSSERYGILWDTYSAMRFRDDAQGARLWAESAPGGVDYYFMGGESMDGVVGAYRRLTGEAPMYARQAFGLFMSKERYTTQDRLVEVARAFRKEQFPLDYIVQDWQYWGSDRDGTWSGMIWNKERFPDPARMTRDIHDLNMKLMISIWPSVGNDTPLGRELDQHGLRFEPIHWISKKARIYDAFSPLGRQIYFKHIKSGLLDVGIDALWMDGTEVEVSDAMHDLQSNIRQIKSLGNNALGDFSRYLNAYTLMTTQGTYDGQRATSDKRVLTLTRSAWAGAQRTAATSWSGDTQGDWATLKRQVAGGVNVTVTGNPYWTQDTGGFFIGYPGGERNPYYRELFARWFQYAAFNPLMRIHGTNIEREPYIFRTLDPQVYGSLLDAVNLRYRMLPYIYGNAWQVTANGDTLMRPLAMDFPDDRRVHAINDAFMFGHSLLVHPVTHAMYRKQPDPAPTVPASALLTPDGKPGLTGQYFTGTAFQKPAGRVVDPVLDKHWPQPPLEAMPPGLSELNNFSAKWEGQLIAPEDGEYELGIEGDDGYRLFVNGAKLVEDWATGAARYKGGKVTLRRGQRVPIRIEFFQGDGGRALRLAWRTPSRIVADAAKTDTGPDLTMRTYLPAGAGWYDFWTNERHGGGTTAQREAPMDIVPLYVRAGSILPLGPQQQYATEKLDAPYEIRVYPGADARFTMYEDDNETYQYEKGARATYDLVWTDATRTLSIGARQGSYPGLVKTRRLDIVVAGAGNGGLAAAPATRTVTYDGSAQRITLPAAD